MMALALAVAAGVASWAGPAAAAPAEPPSRQQVQSAADRVRADPNLPGSKSEKTLRFKSQDKEKEKAQDNKKKDTDSLRWLKDLVTQVSEGARLLVWALGALALAWLVVRIRRWVQVRARGDRHRMAPLPSHIGSLDIRPASLPDDVGAAVAGLWQRGQRRPALSLLYRGALSRLVHLHAVPIRSASTEGECITLSTGRLAPASMGFLAQLVAAWQLAAYGGHLPSTASVLALCAEFDARLGVSAGPAKEAA